MGARIATIRKLRGLSQSELGDAIGVSFQQVQKYEKGQNRVGAGRLAAVAGMLGVAITELYGEVEGLPDDATLAERLSFDGAVDLLALYAAIPAAEQRRSLLNVARALAGAPVGAA